MRHVVIMCPEISNNFCSCFRMPQNAFFLRTRDLLVSPKTTQRHFLFTLHPLSTVIFLQLQQYWHLYCFAILISTSTVIHSVKQRLLRNRLEVRCDLSRLLSRKITKRIHSSKPASLNRLIGDQLVQAPDPCEPVWPSGKALSW